MTTRISCTISGGGTTPMVEERMLGMPSIAISLLPTALEVPEAE